MAITYEILCINLTELKKAFLFRTQTCIDTVGDEEGGTWKCHITVCEIASGKGL